MLLSSKARAGHVPCKTDQEIIFFTSANDLNQQRPLVRNIFYEENKAFKAAGDEVITGAIYKGVSDLSSSGWVGSSGSGDLLLRTWTVRETPPVWKPEWGIIREKKINYF